MEEDIRLIKADKPLLGEVDLLDREIFASSPWGTKALQSADWTGTSGCLAAVSEREGKKVLLGYVLFSLISEAEIYRIAVRPDMRRKGLGRSLLGEAERLLQELGCESIFLEVRDTNEAAVSLYSSEGFREIYMRRAYYRDPVCDALIMEKKL